MNKLALVVLLAIPVAAFAGKAPEVYKWVDDKGVVHYTDKPPNDNATPAKLPPLQTYKGGTNPDLSKFDKSGQNKGGGAAAPGRAQIQIVAPAAEETFRGGDRVVPVAVMVTPALSPGQKLIYLLDGTPQATPTESTSYALTGVERGEHQVSVALIDENGQQLAQSGSVTFYMHPPTVNNPAAKKK